MKLKWLEDAQSISFSEALFYLVVLVLPFEQLVTIGGFAVTKWIGLLFFLVAITRWNLFFEKVPPALWLLLVFFAFGMLMDFIHFPHFYFAVLNEFVRPILMWVLMVATYNLAIHGRFRRVMFFLVISAIIYAAFQSLDLMESNVSEESINGESGERFAVLGTDVNFAAVYCGLGLLYGVLHGPNMIKTSKGMRLISILGVMFGMAALVKTASRGGALAIVGGILAIAFTVKGFTKQIGVFFLVACLLVGMGSVVMHNAYFHARIQDSVEDGKSSGRQEIWEEARQLIREAPVTGYGYRMYMDHLGARTGKMQRATHNTFLMVLITAGWLGGTFFFLFYLLVLKSVWVCRTHGEGKVLFIWFASLFCGMLTLNLEITKWFWMILALGLAVEKTYPKHPVNRWV